MTCKWIGQGEGCTHNSVSGRSYCEHHLWQVYQKGTHLSKRKKDIQTANNVRFWEDCFDQAVQELEEEGFL